MGLLSIEDCVSCQENPQMECKKGDKTKEGQQCFRCVQRTQECAELGLIGEEECDACASDPKKECIADKQTKEGKQCYQCVTKPETCADLGFITDEKCRQCSQDPASYCEPASKTKEGRQCFACKPKTSACADRNLLSSFECEYKCAKCVADQKAPNGDQCFKCNMPPPSKECLDNDYYQDCSQCKEGEICEEVGLILFYPDQDKSLFSCYSCTPKKKK